MTSRVALDTSVAFHLVTAKPVTGQAAAWSDATELVELSDRYEFFLPTPTLGEVLCVVPPEVREKTQSALCQTFAPLMFDIQAARAAADLWYVINRSAKRKALKITRESLKVDHQIVGCAIRYKMDFVCSTDARLIDQVAPHGMRVRLCTPAQLMSMSQRALRFDETPEE